MIFRTIALALLVGLLPLATPVFAQDDEEEMYENEDGEFYKPEDGYLHEGYFVVVLHEAVEKDYDFYERMMEAMSPCGIEPHNDWGWKYDMPEYANVAVIGGYRNEKDAQMVLDAVKSCSPDAYIKYASYAGE